MNVVEQLRAVQKAICSVDEGLEDMEPEKAEFVAEVRLIKCYNEIKNLLKYVRFINIIKLSSSAFPIIYQSLYLYTLNFEQPTYLIIWLLFLLLYLRCLLTIKDRRRTRRRRGRRRCEIWSNFAGNAQCGMSPNVPSLEHFFYLVSNCSPMQQYLARSFPLVIIQRSCSCMFSKLFRYSLSLISRISSIVFSVHLLGFLTMA